MLNWEQLETNLERYKEAFDKASPFRHVVIENFLDPEVAKAVEAGFEVALAHKNHGAPKAHKDVLLKTGTPKWDLMTPAQVDALKAVNSDRFTSYLEELTFTDRDSVVPKFQGATPFLSPFLIHVDDQI